MAIKTIKCEDRAVADLVMRYPSSTHFDHPCLVRYLESPFFVPNPDTPEEPNLCYVMENYEGTLFDLIKGIPKRSAPLNVTFELAKALLLQLTEGLSHLHGHNLMHCDLNHRTVVFQSTPFGYRLKILDSPWAHHIIRRHYDATLKGPRGFVAPEIEWKKDYGGVALTCDVYSLGLIFWMILTGNDPEEADIRDNQTGTKIKITHLAADHSRDALTKKLHHKGQHDFDSIIRFTLQSKPYARPFENMIACMVQFDPGARFPQAISQDTVNRINAIRATT